MIPVVERRPDAAVVEPDRLRREVDEADEAIDRIPDPALDRPRPEVEHVESRAGSVGPRPAHVAVLPLRGRGPVRVREAERRAVAEVEQLALRVGALDGSKVMVVVFPVTRSYLLRVLEKPSRCVPNQTT